MVHKLKSFSQNDRELCPYSSYLETRHI